MTRRPFRILVTGWRGWPISHRSTIWRALDGVAWDVPAEQTIVVVQGECPYGGVDLYGKEWAEQEPRATAESLPAEGGPEGQILGPARNSRMVDLGADLCLGFPGPKSRGTWDCLRKAVDADIPTRVHAWCTAWATAGDE